MKYCQLCNLRNKKKKGRSIIEGHHIRYSPPVMIDLCRSCHRIVSNYERNPSVYNIEDVRFDILKTYIKLREEKLEEDSSGILPTTMIVSFRLQDNIMGWLQTRSRGKPIAEYIKDMVMKAYKGTVYNGNESISVKPSKPELQAMIHNIERGDAPLCPTSVQPTEIIPWYNPERHTTGDTVRMVDPRTKVVKTVTL